MKRQQARRALVPLLLVLLCPHAARAQTSTASYCAPLLGSEVVAPHVNTNARGLADFTFTQSDSAWTGDYNITIFNASNIHSVEAHQAPRASLGDLVYYFYGPVDNPSLPGINGVLLEGNIDPAQLKGPLHGKGVKDMRDRADDGDLYILVVTAQNPNGELRGQLVPVSSSACSLPPAPTPAPGPVPAKPVAAAQPQKVPARVPEPVPAPKPAAAQSPVPEPVPSPKAAAAQSPVPEPTSAPKAAAAASPSPGPAAPPKLPPSPSPSAAAATSPAPKQAASSQPVPGPVPSPPP
ncbi:g1665 [Coccomyxa elongata]